MSVFAWKSQASVLATTDRTFRNPVTRPTPTAASQISYSRNVPHSINTEAVSHTDKLRKLRGAIR